MNKGVGYKRKMLLKTPRKGIEVIRKAREGSSSPNGGESDLLT